MAVLLNLSNIWSPADPPENTDSDSCPREKVETWESDFLIHPSWCCWSEGYTLRGKDLHTTDLKGMILFKWPRDTVRAKEQGVLSVLNCTPDIYMHAKSLQLCPAFCDPVDSVARQAPLSMGVSSKHAGVGCQALLQGIFLTQGSDTGLLCLLYWQADSLRCTTRDTWPLAPLKDSPGERGI